MKDRRLVDTNIIAYALDRSDKAKQGACRKIVEQGFQGESDLAVSSQVLAELFVVLTQKVARPITRQRASVIVRSFVDSAAWKKLSYDSATVARAVTDSISMPNHFWDLLVAETMKEGGVKRIYTENVRDFQGIPWVEAVNPMAEDRAPGETGKRRAAAGEPRKRRRG
jgi:predicted nucleic acid-binding protein